MKGDTTLGASANDGSEEIATVQPRKNGVVWGILAMVALLLILAYYFFGHKPISPDNAVAFVRVGLDNLLVLLIVLAAGAIGRRLVPGAHPEPIAALAFQAALGLGIIGLGMLALGAVGGFHRWTLYLALAALIIGLWRHGWAWLRQARRTFDDVRRGSWAWRAAAAAGASLLLLAWFEAASPPARFDALVYHLALPARFVDQHSVGLTAENPFWGMPLLGEMLYTWAMALGRAQTAALLGWAVAALTVLGVAGVGKGWGNRIGWVAPLALLGGSTLASSPGWAYVDWWAALFGLGVLIALDRYRQSRESQALLLAGAMAGFACGVKYTAWIALPAGFFAVWLCGRDRAAFKQALMFLVVGLAVAAPWLVKNMLGAGAPLFPYFGASPAIVPQRQQALQGSVVPPPAIQSLLLPIAATLSGHAEAPGFGAEIGPLLLGLLPGLALFRRQDRQVLLPVGGFLIAGWVLWAVASRFSGLLIQTRLYFVLLPAWALLAGAGFSGWRGVRLSGVRFGRLAGTAVALVIALLIVQQARQWIAVNPAAVLMGEESSSAYLTRRLGALQVASEGLDLLPVESRVIMLWEPRGLYCQPRCVPDVWIDRWFVDLRRLGSGEAVLEDWKKSGASHVLLNVAGMEFIRQSDPRYSPSDWTALDGLLDRLQLVQAFGDGYALYLVP